MIFEYIERQYSEIISISPHMTARKIIVYFYHKIIYFSQLFCQ